KKGEEICHLKGKEKRKEIPEEEAVMSRITSSAVTIQTSPQSVPSTPSWMGEVAVVAQYLSSLGLLEKMVLEVRSSRKRFGIYDTIGFLDKFGDKSSSSERLANVHPFLERFLAVCL